MATMFGAPDASDPPSEHQVFDALKTLPDDWRVFYSVAWQAARGKYMSDGETDFVLLHPEHGMLMLEVKGGGIRREADDRWFTINPQGEFPIANPVDQAMKGKYALTQYIADRSPTGRKPHAGHIVCFPSITVEHDFGPEAPRSIIWDRVDLRDPAAALERACRHWNGNTSFKARELTDVERALAPTRTVKRLMSDRVDDIVYDLIQLTEQQMKGMRMLRRQRRALVVGGAGTGKTALAAERARQLADDGNDVLLLCFNRPLGEALAGRVDDERITAASFHAWARRLVDEAGLLPEGDVDAEFWDVGLPSLVPDASSKLGRTWDAVVIDEGQDFRPEWWTALMLVLDDPDNDVINVFADDNQNIYRNDWEPPFEADPFVLDVNCRNTNQISERVNAVLGLEGEALGVDGPKPTWVDASTPEKVISEVGAVVDKVVNVEGLPAADLVVLSTDRSTVDALRADELAGWDLVPVGGDGIVAETVHRFKGLEAGVVVLVVPEVSEWMKPLIYVGMSRARAVLHVIGPKAGQEVLGW